MPCYTVRTMCVKFRAAHADVLEEALRSLGWTFTRLAGGYLVDCDHSAWSMRLDLDAGTAELQPEQQPRLNELKRAYAAAALGRVAEVNRWRITTQPGQGQSLKGALAKGGVL